MSRWATEFSQHPFQPVWRLLVHNLEMTEVDDKTIPTSVEELARLKSVVSYLDSILKSIDPEITPKSIWTNFHSQLLPCFAQLEAYISNKNINHVVQANEHIDNLLTYVKPYQVFPKESVKALQLSAKSYSTQLEEYINAFRSNAEASLKTIEVNSEKSNVLLSTSTTQANEIYTFQTKLLADSEEAISIKTQIANIQTLIEGKSEEINELHEKLLTGDTSTLAGVVEAEESITESKNKIEGWANTLSGQVKQLTAFHTKIYGEKNPETNKLMNGLEQELDLRTKQLVKLEKDQETKHAALFEKIEGLLPGATNAGLASSYGKLKGEFTKPIATYTKLFYLALFLLVIAAIEKINFWPNPYIQFIEIKDLEYTFKTLLHKIPLIAPVLWLALFASTRRSQYERLQQEYAHKEALATSYESYKKQIQDLKGDSDELQKELISKAINAIAYNASVTLDGKHEDKTPMQQVIEKFGAELKSITELTKKPI